MLKTQKVIKVGNSLAVTLDKDFVTKTGIQAGDGLVADYDAKHQFVSVSKSANGNTTAAKVSKKRAIVAGKITPELEAWTDKFLEKNEEAMIALKDL